MADIERQLLDDLAIRNAAKAVLNADIALVKGDVNPAPQARQLAVRARDLSAEAADLAQANKGKVGSGLAIVVIGLLAWFFRDRIADLIKSFIASDSGSGGEQ